METTGERQKIMNKQQLAAKIWESANKLRSKIEANEYKDYILGFIFYKYLSDRELKYVREEGFSQEDIAALSENDTQTMEYIQKNIGYFIAYKDLFSTWLSMGRNFDVSNVRDALSAFSRLINDSHKKVFSGIFKTLETGLSKLGENSASQTKAISSLLQLIKDIPMDGRQDYDVLGFIYEYLIGMFAANAGKKAGEFYTPHEVSVLMSEIVANHLKNRTEIKIYDPTSGSGSLLINIGHSIARYMHERDRIKYYAQELKENTYNLTRMNLIMRGILPDNIVTRNGDTLEEDWPYFEDNDPAGTYEPLYVDAVVSNPPYSQHWDSENKEHDVRFSNFGVAPKSKADYAFLLHDLFHLRPDGIMTIVLPHGVLFRGDAEGEIRKQLLECNHIDAVIGLPANIFFGTGIPTIIMVLKKNRPNTDVMIIDASKGFAKVGKSNQLRASDIRRIADTVIGRIATAGYSRPVELEEIRANDYNLNIPRYIDSNESAEHWDIHALMFGGIPEEEINELDFYWQALPGLREALFTGNGHSAQLAAEDIETVFNQHPAVQNFRTTFDDAFSGLRDFLKAELLGRTTELIIPHEETTLSADIFKRLSGVPLIDKYEAYQLLDDEWEKIAVDLEILQTEGMDAATKVDPNMILKKKDGKDEEIQDGWTGRIIPFPLAQEKLLPEKLSALKQKEDELSTVVADYEQLIEELSEEDKSGDFFDTEKNDFIAAELKKALKEKSEEPELLAVLKKADDLTAKTKALRKEVRQESLELHLKTKATIETLTPDQVQMLLEAKWIHPLVEKLNTLPMQILSGLMQKIKALSEKYTDTLPDMERQITETESELANMLEQLTGSAEDLAGLAELKKMLEDK
mgnify:CR=1 FL=1